MSAQLWEGPQKMLDTDDLALWYALNRLMTNYWADVDSNGGELAHEFYLPDALYAVGSNRFEGEQKIRAFYARRRQRGRTTTRHLVDNLRVFQDDGGHARAVGVMCLFVESLLFELLREPIRLKADQAEVEIGEPEVLDFGAEQVQVPAPPIRQLVVGQAVGTLVLLAPAARNDHRDRCQPQLRRGTEAPVAGKKVAFLVDQHRRRPSPFADGRGKLVEVGLTIE